MKIKIPIFIILLNDSELNIYKNEKLLKYIKESLEKYALYNDCIFLYAGEKNDKYIKENNIENSYHVNSISKISHSTEFIAIYEYISHNDFKYDWFINMNPSQLLKNNTIYEAIRNIDNKYDFICFSNLILNQNQYQIDEDNKIFHNGFIYNDDIIKIIDTSLFVTKTEWFKYSCKESNLDKSEFGKIFWSGKYNILEMFDQLQIKLVSIGQVDNFLNLINNINNK